MIHIVKKDSTNHRAAQKPKGTAHKNQRKTANIAVHICCQILKCGSQYSNTHSQTQEGGTQDHRDEPAQHASRPAAPPGARRRRIRRRGLGLEEPLPGSRGPGPTEFQLQLQLGGSGVAVLLAPGFLAEPRELGAEPRPRPSRPGQPR